MFLPKRSRCCLPRTHKKQKQTSAARRLARRFAVAAAYAIALDADDGLTLTEAATTGTYPRELSSRNDGAV